MILRRIVNISGISAEGFTLVEMMVALAIFALAIGMASSAFQRSDRDSDPLVQANKLQKIFFQARLRAIAQGSEQQVVVDIRDRIATDAGNKNVTHFPDGLQLGLFAGRELIAADRAATFIFFPDGSASGGAVAFTNAKEQIATTRLNWLTGIPEVLAEAP